nr:putative ribonuclease H-like domain-containing protein [Tanacetum cinerariifolium]
MANSTIEAKYIVAFSCCGHVLWLQNQLFDYGYNFMQTNIHVDNESAIYVVKNPVYHSKTKHIEIRHHFIRNSYEKRLIEMVKIHTDSNVADLLTKAFDVTRFHFLVASIEIEFKGYLLNDSYTDLVQHADKKELAIPRQMATGKEFLNPLMAGSLPKTISAKVSAANSKTVNSMKQIHAIVDGRAVVISESLVRSDILFDDEDGITCLTNDQIFKNLALMGYEPLSTKLTFQKGIVTPIFDTMLVQHQAPEGEDEAVNQDESDRVERAITTDASLEATHDSDNLTKTQTTTMPNVDIPQGIDTGGRLRRQETIRGTSAQTRSESVLEQPNEPPLTEDHTSGSGEGRLEENIKLTDTVPTTHDSPLIGGYTPRSDEGGYTPRSDEGRITLAELMETCTTLSNRVTQLETKLSTTKAIYNKAFITLTNRVKKLESQLKQKRSRAVIPSSDEKGLSETAEHSRDDDNETLAKTLLNIKKSLSKDKGKGIMQKTELPKKLKKKEMIHLSLDEELAQKLYAEELAKEEARQEHKRYNLEKALELQRQLDQRKENVPKGDQANEINLNDPQVLRYHALQNRPFSKAEVKKNMIMYLKNQGRYKQSYFKGIKYKDIRPLFERIWDQVYTFVPKDSEIEREVMKRAIFDPQQGSSKKQRLD